jgi:hypothetical protein
VSIDSLAILTSSLASPGALPTGIAIALRNTIGTSIERCVLAQVGAVRGGTDTTTTLTNVAPVATTGLSTGPRAAGAPLIALDGFVVETLVREDVLIGTTGIGAVWGALYTEMGFTSMATGIDERLRTTEATSAARGSGYVLAYDLAIEDNLFVCFLNGIALEGFTVNVGDTSILRNSILGGLRAGIVVNGLTLPAMSRVDVTGNMLQVFGFGIAVGTDDTRVADNDVYGLILRGANLTGAATVEATSALRRADAIVLSPSIRPSGIDRCQVRGNRIGRVVGDAISIRTQVRSAQISHNTIQGIGGNGIAMEDNSSADSLVVESNQILNVGAVTDPGERRFGILLRNGVDVAAVGNTIHGISTVAPAGILVDSRRSRIAGNDIGDIGTADSGGGGIEATGERVDVIDNSVRRVRDPGAQPSMDVDWYGIFVVGSEPKQLTTEVAGVAVAAFARNVFPVTENTAISINPARGEAVKLPRGRSSIAVHGNLVEAVGQVQAVYLQTGGSCLFNDNRCFHVTRRSTVVKVFAGALVASDNYLEGIEKLPAADLTLPGGAGFTVSGNVSSGEIQLNGSGLPSPWDQLNVP